MRLEEDADTRPDEGAVKRLEQNDDMIQEETTKMRQGQHSDEFREKDRNAKNPSQRALRKEE